MTGTTEAYDFHGRTLIDRDGEKIGQIDEVYADQQGGQPEWALVNTGLFGTKKTFVPITGANPNGEDLTVPVSKQQVKDAPRIDADQELSEDEERRLFEHYEVPYTTEGSTTATGTAGSSAPEAPYDVAAAAGDYDRGAADIGHDTSGPNTDSAMTRSEEELRVGTATRETGRVRLRKYIVTEHVQTTVPVQREEVRIEREPITDENRDQALSGPEISEEEHEITLHAEEPVVEKRTVPKERVRLDVETHEDESQVSEDVRKEQIEVDDSQSGRP
jgi:uncharacterized protein (TIGR02271 family)